MFRNTVLAAGAVAALTGSAGAETLDPYDLSETQMIALQDAVGNELKDPHSAQYEGVAARIDSMKLVHACGYVNAKNSLGAYTGKTPFYVSIIPYEEPKAPMVFQKVYSENASVIGEIVSICQSHGLGLD